MKKILFIIACFLMICSACNESHKQGNGLIVYDLENPSPPIEFADLVKSMDFIALETKPECILSEISELKFHDTLLFIKTSINYNAYLLLFNTKGRFLNKIGEYGKSGEEYQSISCWCVDTLRNEVVIIDGYTKQLKRYGYDGKFIERINYDKQLHNVCRITCLPGDCYGFTNIILPGEGVEQPEFLIANKELTQIIESKPTHWKAEYHTVPINLLYGKGEAIYARFLLNDTLYHFQDGAFKPHGFYKTGIKFPDGKHISSSNMEIYKNVRWENSIHNGLVIRRMNKKMCYIPDVNSERVLEVSPLLNNLSYGMTRYTSGKQIDPINPWQLKEYVENNGDKYPRLTQLSKSIGDEDNPVLIIYNFE
ncbi:MAG: 6-bladed beta-propeller [Marinifilaceae bacterium]